MSRSNCKKLTSLLLTSKQFWALVGLLLLICAQINEAQFFTKSSKSIPRMGRRSDSSIEQSFNRVPLIDILLDEYGPDLAANILGKHIDENRVSLSSGEVAYNNEQPIDWNGQLIDYGNGLSVSRNERSQATKSNKPNNHDASLAMRAFNTNRLLQYLSSGQPLTSYDRLLTTQKYQGSNKGESQRRIVNDRK